ncbi:MAG: DUF1801 domain-containing protein [Rhizomicrobium sp.]
MARAFAKADEIDAFFAGYPESTSQIAQALRRLILQNVEGAEETLDRSARVVGYGFGPGYKDTVCAIIPSLKGVKLGLAHGASLPDPKNILAGAGKVHRHIAFNSVADVKRASVKALLKSSYKAWKMRGESKQRA